MLRVHHSAIESAIQASIAVASYSLNVVQLSPATGYIEGEIVFAEGVRLVFFEFWRRSTKDVEQEKYRYHLMDIANQLVFRYDNAPHHPNIATFPDHKHVPDGITKSSPPNFADVLIEVEAYVLGLP